MDLDDDNFDDLDFNPEELQILAKGEEQYLSSQMNVDNATSTSFSHQNLSIPNNNGHSSFSYTTTHSQQVNDSEVSSLNPSSLTDLLIFFSFYF